MGYPMTWARVVSRNQAYDSYATTHKHRMTSALSLANDLRRIEHDQRDPYHIALYAEYAGITEEQAKHVLDAFFFDFPQAFWSRPETEAIFQEHLKRQPMQCVPVPATYEEARTQR